MVAEPDPPQGADRGRGPGRRSPLPGRDREPAAPGAGVRGRLRRRPARGGRRARRRRGRRGPRAVARCGSCAAGASAGSCCSCRASTTGRLLAAAEAGVTGVLRRSEATAGNLAAAIRSAAAGEGTLPPDLLGRLLRQVGQLQRQVLSPRGLTFSGLTEREASVVRLLADGYDTAEIAQPPVLLRADGQEHHPRHHVAARAAQPDARRRVRDPGGPDLAGLRPRLPARGPRARRPMRRAHIPDAPGHRPADLAADPCVCRTIRTRHVPEPGRSRAADSRNRRRRRPRRRECAPVARRGPIRAAAARSGRGPWTGSGLRLGLLVLFLVHRVALDRGTPRRRPPPRAARPRPRSTPAPAPRARPGPTTAPRPPSGRRPARSGPTGRSRGSRPVRPCRRPVPATAGRRARARGRASAAPSTSRDRTGRSGTRRRSRRCRRWRRRTRPTSRPCPRCGRGRPRTTGRTPIPSTTGRRRRAACRRPEPTTSCTGDADDATSSSAPRSCTTPALPTVRWSRITVAASRAGDRAGASGTIDVRLRRAGLADRRRQGPPRGIELEIAHR